MVIRNSLPILNFLLYSMLVPLALLYLMLVLLLFASQVLRMKMKIVSNITK